MKKVNKLFKIPYKKQEKEMAKRYTDSEKWKKDFIKTLPTEYKLFWLYLLDECDHAGIWHVELDIAEMRLGYKLSLQKIRGLFKGKVVEFDNETKWFIPDFISFQYGQLDVKNKAHKSVIEKLDRYVKKGLPRVLYDPKDKDKEKDNPSLSNTGIDNTGEIFNFSGIGPPVKEVVEWFMRNGQTEKQAMKFYNYQEGLGWKKGITKISNWAAFANMWMADNHDKGSGLVKFRGPTGEGTMPVEEWNNRHEGNANSSLRRIG